MRSGIAYTVIQNICVTETEFIHDFLFSDSKTSDHFNDHKLGCIFDHLNAIEHTVSAISRSAIPVVCACPFQPGRVLRLLGNHRLRGADCLQLRHFRL